MVLALLEEDLRGEQERLRKGDASGEGEKSVNGVGHGTSSGGEERMTGEKDNEDEGGEKEIDVKEEDEVEEREKPEWVRMMEKHRIQAARLEALASGQERRVTSGTSEVMS